MRQRIKGLSLWQPWASLMAVGAKKIETRSWSTPYRGYVAIHAAKKWNADLRETAMGVMFQAALQSECSVKAVHDESVKRYSPSTLPRGCFVAVGRLQHCFSTTDHSKLIPTCDERWFGDYSEDRFMWVFDEIWKLSSPVYAIGQRNLWHIEEDQAGVIIDMLPDEVREQEFGE